MEGVFDSNYYNKLLMRILRDRRKENSADVVVITGWDHFPAHKLVLAAKSEYFNEIIQADPKVDKIFIIELSAFQIKHALDYFYNGTVEVKEEEKSFFLEGLKFLRPTGELPFGE